MHVFLDDFACLASLLHGFTAEFTGLLRLVTQFLFLYIQAKKFVESLPQVVQKDIGKEEAEKLRSALEAAGGIVEIE